MIIEVLLIREMLVNAGDVLTLGLKIKDGAAFWIMPKDE
jgi:hypothetical protein